MPNIENAYVSELGQPRLRTSIVGFLDILGFSEIAAADTCIDDSQRVLEKIVAAIDDSRQFVRQMLAGQLPTEQASWAVKFFSDNLVLGYPIDAGDAAARAAAACLIVHCTQRYQLRMALNGYFLRGGLTIGPICLTDEIIFGSALIDCYQLESKASIVPRIILSESLQKLVGQHRPVEAVESKFSARDAICRDIDGRWFINYLQATCKPDGVDWQSVQQHKQAVQTSLSGTTRHDVLPKYGWTCRYHNVFCHWHQHDPGYADRFRIDRADEHSTIHQFNEFD